MSCLLRTKSEPGMAGDSDKSLKRASTGGRALPHTQHSAWWSSGSIYLCVLPAEPDLQQRIPLAEVIVSLRMPFPIQAPNHRLLNVQEALHGVLQSHIVLAASLAPRV